jgi:hypothetical protein
LFPWDLLRMVLFIMVSGRRQKIYILQKLMWRMAVY